MYSAIAMNLICALATAQLGAHVQDESSISNRILCGDIDYAEFEIRNQGQRLEHFHVSYEVNVWLKIRTSEVRDFIFRTDVFDWMVFESARPLKPKASSFEVVLLAPWLKLQDPVFDVEALQTISQASADSNLPHQDLAFVCEYRIYPKTYEGKEEARTAEFIFNRIQKVKGYVLLKKPRVEYLYFSPLDVEINKEYDYNGRLGPQYKQARSRGATQYERMMPVDWNFFGVPLNNFYRVPEHFDELVTQLNPESRLYRLCKLVHMANDWVQTPDGDERTRKEQLMLGYASQGGKIESKYLTTKIQQLIATKALEYGAYVAPIR